MATLHLATNDIGYAKVLQNEPLLKDIKYIRVSFTLTDTNLEHIEFFEKMVEEGVCVKDSEGLDPVKDQTEYPVTEDEFELTDDEDPKDDPKEMEEYPVTEDEDGKDHKSVN